MKKTLVLLAMALGMATFTKAQNQKFGYINSLELLSIMPDSKKADADLATYAKTFEDQLKTMQTELETKYKDFQTKEKTLSDAIKEVKQTELESLNGNIQKFQQSAQDKLSKKKEELYNPIIAKADKAIKDVAKANNFTYVFDTNSTALLFAPDGDNILPLVKTKLGITTAASSGK